MKDEVLNDALLRQFLLGNVNDEERQRIESLFLTDSVIRDRVLAVEQDLIEDYLEESLLIEDKERFLERYAKTPAQQRQLRITKSIKDWAVMEAAGPDPSIDVNQSGHSSISLWMRVRDSLRFRHPFIVPITIVIILAVVFGIIWLNRRSEQRRHLAIEQEVARLNDPANLRNVPPAQDALTIRPGTLRSGGSPFELKLRSDLPAVELRLLWLRRESYPMYRAVVRRFDDDEAIRSPNLYLESDGKTIRLLLPSRMLRKGLYQIHVNGMTAEGNVRETEEYQFTVVD